MRRRVAKVLGERNTGTTYLTLLIEQNLPVYLLRGTAPLWLQRLDRKTGGRARLVDRFFAVTGRWNLGWKHRLVGTGTPLPRRGRDGSGVGYVAIVKNPYSWLLSLHRRPYHNAAARRLSFEDFVVAPWPTVARETAPTAFASPVHLWNAKNRAYLALAEQHDVALIRYETLLSDPAATLRSVALELGVDWDAGTFRDHELSTKDSGRDQSHYRDFYLNERWRERLSAEAVRRVDERLDVELAERLGYARLVPQGAPGR